MGLKSHTIKSANKIAAFAFNEKLPTYYNGDWLWLSRRCWASLYLNYEPYMAAAIRSNLSRGDTFWDVGANIGLFSLFAARIVGPEGKVVSFEPSPDVFEVLCENVGGDSGPIQALQYGIGNADGSALLSAQGASTAGSFVAEVVELSRHYYQNVPIRKTSVTMRKLDTLLNDLKPSPNLVKIDIEGFEVEAIKGADHLFQAVRPIAIIEIHPLQIKLSGSSEDELFQFLRKHSYGYEIIDKNASNSLYSIVAKPLESRARV
jgi:FkbM family methyltransferase